MSIETRRASDLPCPAPAVTRRRLERSFLPLNRARTTGAWSAIVLTAFVTQVASTQTSQPSVGANGASPPFGNGNATSKLAAVTRTETGLLDIHVRDMELATLLEMLSYQARANIVTSTSVTGRVSANLYAVNIEQALAAVLTPNQYTFRVSGNTVFVGKQEEMIALQPVVTRVFKLRYVRPQEAATAIQALLGTEGTVVQGGGEKEGEAGFSSGTRSGSDEMTGAGVDYVIVSAQPERFPDVEQLLRDIDQRPRQVLIESTVLRATLNETNEFGVDFTMLGGVDFQNVDSTSNASADLTTGQLPQSKLENTTFNVHTTFSGSTSGDGFTFGIIQNNIAAFIHALEEVTDVVVVANPKIVALNKQEGEVIVGRRDGYLTTTVTQTAAVQTVEFLETGTQIKFRPVINDDGTIRLVVHPKDSNGGLTAANLPFEETTEAHADILVDDGATVLIGGLFRERTVNSKSQLPVLGNIPWGGLLFGNRKDTTTREEVIILLTVHVLKDTKQENQQFRELVDDVERVRVGSRRGLMATGRERLAQACYHEALRQLEAGNSGLALLNVRMALNNQPTHLPALRLRDQLLNERSWDEDGRPMRTFALDLIGLEQAAPPRPFGRPRPDLQGPVGLEGADEPSGADESSAAGVSGRPQS